MRVLESTPISHTEGVIYVELDSAKEPVFTIGRHVHDAISAAGGEPKLQQHPVYDRLKRGRDALQAIPVRVMFDDAKSNLLARYEAWGNAPSQGPLCIGNGERAKVYNKETQAWEVTPCRGPALCPIPSNQGLACALRTKVLVTVEDEGEDLGVFEFRTSAENSYRSILSSLIAQQAKHGTLRNIPMSLTGWAKSTQGSSYEPFACATLDQAKGATVRAGHEADESWELLGRITNEAWMAECTPTAWEMQPLKMPPPKINKMAPRAHAAGGADSLFANVLERLKDSNERSSTF